MHKCGFHGEHLLANGELNTNVLSSLVDPTDSAIAKGFVIDCDTFLHLRVIECGSLRLFDLGLRRSGRRLDAISGSDQIRLLLFWLRLRFGLRLGSDRGSRHDLFLRLRSDHCEGGNFLGSLHGCLLIVEQPLVLFTLDNSVPTTDVFTFVAIDTSVRTSLNVRSSQTIFIRILCTSQFVKTVGSEAFFEFLEIRNLNF